MSKEDSGATLLLKVANFLSGSHEVKKMPASTLNSLLLVHFNLVAYALCYWMQQPVLPFLAKELGAEGTSFGLLQSFVSGFSLIGGPLFGLLTDSYGPKSTLILNQACSACMYFLISVSYTMPVLFLSQVPAVGQHLMLCSQAALSLVTKEEDRSSAMGRLGLSYGIGMILGGPIGGVISGMFGFRASAFASGLFSLVLVVGNILYFPDLFTKKNDEDAKSSKKKEESSFSLKKIVTVLKITKLRQVLILSAFLSLGIGSFRTCFSLAAASTDSFFSEFDSKVLGFYMSFVALNGLICNVFLVNRVIDFFKGDYKQVILFCCGILGLSYAIYPWISSVVGVFALSIPIGVGSSLFYVLGNSLVSLSVGKEDQGTALSFSHATRSFVGLISPLVGGIVYDQGGITAAASLVVVCAVLTGIYSILMASQSLKDISLLQNQSQNRSQES